MSNHESTYTVSVDFDGVIHKFSKGWQDGSIYDEPMPGARKAIKQMIKEGLNVVVSTCREVESVKRWLSKQGFVDLEVTNSKPYAIAYIDDRAVKFETWATALRAVREAAKKCES